MAQAVFFGTDASLTTTGFGGLYNSFSVQISQGYAEAVGFGDTFVRRKGTVIGATANLNGFITDGSTTDQPGLAAMTRAGATLTLTFFTGCTMAFTAIMTGIGLGVAYTGTQDLGHTFVSTGTITQTWVTT